MQNKIGILVLLMIWLGSNCLAQSKKLKLAIDGLTHGHVAWVFNHKDTSTFELVGIAESNKELAKSLSDRYGFSMDLVYPSLKELLKKVQPEAVAAFNSTYEHLNTVQRCAPKGIHVMVEKPLAVNLEHVSEMELLANKHQIHLITNYETTWYATHARMFEMVANGKVGKIRKVIVNDGHAGPKEIRVGAEFLDWLVDPKRNGGGALTDFGCYGANLMLKLTDGEMPQSVYCSVRTYKPETYEKVDDDATLILEYPDMQVVIQPSWNWSFSRKDMEVYGDKGYVIARNRSDLSYRLSRKQKEETITLDELDYPNQNCFDYLKAVVRGEVSVKATDLSSVQNNVKVVRILEAAKQSAKSGKQVSLNIE
ncbi:MAG: Gfo/Idh/MocA family oxidoreductase [Cyclobacteriaceae bacterium]